MNKVGKNTPVYRFKDTDEVVCGATLQEALGVSPFFDPRPGYTQVSELPPELRPVICDGVALPRNDICKAIAKAAMATGSLTIEAYGRKYVFEVTYCNKTRVIIKE